MRKEPGRERSERLDLQSHQYQDFLRHVPQSAPLLHASRSFQCFPVGAFSCRSLGLPEWSCKTSIALLAEVAQDLRLASSPDAQPFLKLGARFRLQPSAEEHSRPKGAWSRRNLAGSHTCRATLRKTQTDSFRPSEALSDAGHPGNSRHMQAVRALGVQMRRGRTCHRGLRRMS